MRYVFPAIFTPTEDGYAVSMPDIQGCHTCGETLAEAMDMAEDVLGMLLVHAEDGGYPIPTPSDSLPHKAPQFISLIKADTNEWRRLNDNRSVRKNLTIPAWLNNLAEDAHVNFSSILQDALKTHLQVNDRVK